MKVSNTKEIKPTKINALIYAPSGYGKTTLAKTLSGKTLVISLESGLLSLKDYDIDYIEVEGRLPDDKLSHLSEVISFAIKSDYDNIFIDSLTEIAQTFLDSAKKEYPDNKHTMLRFGRYNERLVQFIKYTRDLNKNVFYTSLEKVDKDEVGRRYHVPDLIGAIATKSPAYFDMVFSIIIHENEDEKQRRILTQPVDNYICKDRSGKLDAYEEPDLSKILNKIFKGVLNE